ncbi:MAG TPA: MFS transporter [Thermomicrobiales bacterium]|nr:MFS transporter [Thermomicrobiales bacterium]
MDDLNRPYRRDRSSALAAIFNANLTAFQVALGALMPIVRADLGIGLTLASLHFTINAGCGMLSSYLTPVVAGRIGRKPTIVISLTMVIVAYMMFVLAPSVWFTLATSVLLGLTGSFGLILTQSELMDNHRYHRATATAELTLFVSIFMFLTTITAGPLVELFASWRLVLFVPILALLPAYLILRPMQFSDRIVGAARRSTGVMSPLAWLFCALIIAQTGFEWCYGYLGAEFMNKAGGLSKAAAAASLSLYYGGLVTGRFLLLPAVRRFDPTRLLIVSFGTALTGFLLLAAGPIVGIKLVGLAVSGLGIAFAFPMIATLAATSFPSATDWIIGRIYTFGGLAIAVAPFVIGSLGDAVGIGISFWVIGLLAALGLGLTPLLPILQRMTSPPGPEAV